MCRIFDEIRNEGIEIGREQGIEIGREQGREQGRVMRAYKSVNAAIESFGISLEEALKILKISKEEYLEGKRFTEEEEC